MSTAPAPTKPQKSRKDKDKERDKERKSSLPQPNERLKTVIRRLPPNLPERVFWQSVQPWVTEDTAVWRIYYPGKLRKKLNKENIPSRAYIAFKNEEQLALFSREYDGHTFRDKTGVESQAVVEFAPYPKVPSEKRKPDTRNATIEKDEDYISFLEALKASENAEPVTLESLIASTQPAPHPKTTPLLEALKAEKTANKDKEAILRNHAHYNQINVGPSRKEEKKKAGAASAPPPSKQSEIKTGNATNAAVASGKKAQKKAQGGVPAATAPQNAKNASQGASGPAFKNAANNPPTAKPAKPPRAPRGAQAKSAANDTPHVEPSAALPPSPLDSTNSTAPPAVRRTRPVIGLASRQFEAALSGVSGLAIAATERKRREKEREAQAAAASGGTHVPATPTAPSASFARIDGSDTDKPVAPPSPKKEKTRRGGRGGGGGGAGSSAAAAASANVPQVKVPSILQRAADGPPSSIIQRDTSGPPNEASNGTTSPTAERSSTGPNSRGGGRRGRGAGRGRGGASGAPRGGG
ncbi:Smg-4/UPF3 family-domain-containing protein [Flammula alnicola]|nr:Smg-4/UPF3 family-domain-containing protein [Flammula alnicola]